MTLRERIVDWLSGGLISYYKSEASYAWSEFRFERDALAGTEIELERLEDRVASLSKDVSRLVSRNSELDAALSNIQPGWDGSLKDGVIEEEHVYRGGTVHRIALNSHRVRFPTVDLTAVVDPDDGSLTLSRGTKVFSRFER